MQELLQGFGSNPVVFLGIGCALLCVVGFVLVFGLQIVGTLIQSIFGFFDLFLGILTGGPVAWCGCLLLIMACFVCGGLAIFIANALPACETNPIMFCRLLGY